MCCGLSVCCAAGNPQQIAIVEPSDLRLATVCNSRRRWLNCEQSSLAPSKDVVTGIGLDAVRGKLPTGTEYTQPQRSHPRETHPIDADAFRSSQGRPLHRHGKSWGKLNWGIFFSV